MRGLAGDSEHQKPSPLTLGRGITPSQQETVNKQTGQNKQTSKQEK